MSEHCPLVACVDIGGTKALYGLVDEAGKVHARARFLVDRIYQPDDLAKEVVGRLIRLAQSEGIDWARVKAIGYATTGMLDSETGMIFYSPNQGGWKDIPFGELLTDLSSRPAFVLMDAHAAALGEAWLGAGRTADPFLYIVIGTGVGAGLIHKGEVFQGWRGTAGEIGHMILIPDGPQCYCGNRGCLESLVSGLAIAEQARNRLTSGEESRLRDEDPGKISAEMVFAAARAGDRLATAVIENITHSLAVGLTNVIHLLNPQVIALGGGVGFGGRDLILEPLRTKVKEMAGSWVDINGIKIVASELDERAGLLGAAKHAWKKIEGAGSGNE